MRYRALCADFRLYKKAVQSVEKILNSVRYGNLYERLNDDAASVVPALAHSVNSVIESFRTVKI